MTKYILYGGETGVPNEHNKAFYQEWVKGFTDDFVPTILLVYFSRKDEEFDYLEKSDKERFVMYTNNRSAKFIVADKDPNIFQEQIKKSDVIYVRGGNPEKLMEVLKPVKDMFIELLKDKIYAGSSAGVMALSHFTRSHKHGWKQGLGLLPINSIVHWSEDLQEDLNLFKESHPDDTNEYLLLSGTEFIVKLY